MSDGGLADVLARLGLSLAGPPLEDPGASQAPDSNPTPDDSASQPSSAPIAVRDPGRSRTSPTEAVSMSLRAALEGGATLQAVVASSGMPAGRARRQLLQECFGIDVPPWGILPTRVEAEQMLRMHDSAIRRAAARARDELEDASTLGMEVWTFGWLILLHRDRTGHWRGARSGGMGAGPDPREEARGPAVSEHAEPLRPWPGSPKTRAERRASAAYLEGAGIIGIASQAGTSTDAALAALVRGLAGVAIGETTALERAEILEGAQRSAVEKFDAGVSIEAIANALDQPQAVIAWLLLAHTSGRLRKLG